MGGGSYDRSAHEALTAARVDKPREQVFTQSKLHASLNPYGVVTRESRDTGGRPSRAIILFLDETGSMGHIPENLAKETLPTLPSTLLSEGTLANPQIMVGAVGDAMNYDGRRWESSSLQVGEFETEGQLMDRDLTNIHLEGLGGGNEGESYDLGIYFAARHTSIDCFEKRGEKGFLFIIGDEPGFTRVSAAAVKRVIGDDIERDIPIEDIIAEASKRYHIFFLIPDLHRAGRCAGWWKKRLGANVISMESHEDTSLVAATLIGLTEGTYDDLDALRKSLKSRGVEHDQTDQVYRAVADYAASIGRGGERRPAEDVPPPSGQGKGRSRRT